MFDWMCNIFITYSGLYKILLISCTFSINSLKKTIIHIITKVPVLATILIKAKYNELNMYVKYTISHVRGNRKEMRTAIKIT